MKIFVPNYYHRFRCIAGRCRHNCCVGWEIDIDSRTLEYYNSVPGELGEKIRKNIDVGDDCPHFVLKEGDRCPFLEKDGLCEIIKELGEEALCDICTDHPRFRNFFSEYTELGLGLCCEEAARVVLTSTEPFGLVPLDGKFDMCLTDQEKEILDEREKLFSVICDRSISVFERMKKISLQYSFNIEELFPQKLKRLFLSLERLDEKWTVFLEHMGDFCLKKSILSDEDFSVCFENLLGYFVFRHFSDGMYDSTSVSRVKFAVASTLLVARLCDDKAFENDETDIEDVCEFARMFSSEIEYSQENLDTVFDEI